MRVVIVTNIPTPYRMPVYERLDGTDGIELAVVYLADREPNRSWTLEATPVRSLTLRPVIVRVGKRYIHFTLGVWRALCRSKADVVVTTGFNPPQLVAFAYCLLHRVPHVVQTDGTPRSEAELSTVHRVVRRIVAPRSRGWVAASDAGLELVESWGAPRGQVRKSPLAIDNAAYAAAVASRAERDVDLIFSGQLSEVKNPLFALEVADRAAELLGRRLTVAVLGDGPLRADVEADAVRRSGRIDVQVVGFQQQAQLPDWYARSRVFLFPTRWDPWGLVLNEALAAGAVALVSPEAGSGAELIDQDVNGSVLPLDVGMWAEFVAAVLRDEGRLEAMSAAAQRSVTPYSWDEAAAGIRAALESATV